MCKKISVAAKDVIRGLLKTDPDERLTIREVMQSGWVSVCLIVCLLFHISLSRCYLHMRAESV